jgi:hypothetical protein
MPEMTSVEKSVKAAFERGHDINLHRYPIHFEFDVTKGALILEGEVENIIAKKHAFEIASQVEGIHGVMDRLTVVPSKRCGDGAIRDSLCTSRSAMPRKTSFCRQRRWVFVQWWLAPLRMARWENCSICRKERRRYISCRSDGLENRRG